MMSRLVKNQLRLFALVTVVVLATMALIYVDLPARLGYGRYTVLLELPNSGGLYPRGLVSYRGVEVGEITSIELGTSGGAVARMRIDNDANIPADAIANVRSSSVIGEQYVDFVPQHRTAESGRRLSDGQVVPASQSRLPTTTNELIDSVDQLLSSVPRDDLQTVVRELGEATDGGGENLGRLLDSGAELTAEATRNLKPTTDLIDRLGPVLETQNDTSPNIRRYAKSLKNLTHQLDESDDDLDAILKSGGGFADSVNDFVGALQGQLPGMLWETAATAQVARVYLRPIEHLLIVFPAAVAAVLAMLPPSSMDDDYVRANLYFKGTILPPCTNGFPEADRPRDPTDVSLAPVPKNSYCRAPERSTLVPRGARNNPCPNSERRSATARGCGLEFKPFTYSGAGAFTSIVGGGPR